MTKILIEEAIDDLYDYLYANIAAKLVAIRMEYTDDFLLEDIPSNGWHLGDLPIEMTVLPCLTIRAQGQNLDFVWPTQLLGRHYIQIVIAVGQPEYDASTRFRRLARYARAIFELVQEWQSPTGAGAYEVIWDGQMKFSGVMPVEPYIQAVGISLQLIRKEAY